MGIYKDYIKQIYSKLFDINNLNTNCSSKLERNSYTKNLDLCDFIRQFLQFENSIIAAMLID